MTTPAKIEPWMHTVASLLNDRFDMAQNGEYSLTDAEIEAIIAAHAPKQEPVSAYCPKCSELLMLPQGTAIKELSEREAYLISEADAMIAEYAAREQRLLHQLTLAADSFDTILGEAKIASIAYKRIQAILNEGEKP